MLECLDSNYLLINESYRSLYWNIMEGHGKCKVTVTHTLGYFHPKLLIDVIVRLPCQF